MANRHQRRAAAARARRGGERMVDAIDIFIAYEDLGIDPADVDPDAVAEGERRYAELTRGRSVLQVDVGDLDPAAE
jgi:hypothetical protein